MKSSTGLSKTNGLLHSEDAELRTRRDGAVQRRMEGEAENVAGLHGVDDAVVPEARTGVIGIALALIARPYGCLERLCLFRRPPLRVAMDGRQDRGGLLAAHDGNARVGPGEEEARAVGPAAHPVVAGTERTADEHRDFWDARRRERGDELRAVLGDPFRLVPSA